MVNNSNPRYISAEQMDEQTRAWWRWLCGTYVASALLLLIGLGGVFVAFVSFSYTDTNMPSTDDYLPLRMGVAVIVGLISLYSWSLLVRYWNGPAERTLLELIQSDLP